MKTYKQFVVESNASRDNLYEGLGAVWTGLKLGVKGAIAFGAADSFHKRIPQILNKTNLAKPVADLTRNIPGVGPSLENWVKTVRKEKPKPKPNEEPNDDSKSNPRCGDAGTHRYVPSTNKCVLK